MQYKKPGRDLELLTTAERQQVTTWSLCIRTFHNFGTCLAFHWDQKLMDRSALGLDRDIVQALPSRRHWESARPESL